MLVECSGRCNPDASAVFRAMQLQWIDVKGFALELMTVSDREIGGKAWKDCTAFPKVIGLSTWLVELQTLCLKRPRKTLSLGLDFIS